MTALAGIGNIPSEWEAVPARRFLMLRKEAARSEDSIVTAVRDGTVTLRKNRRTDGYTEALKEHGYQHVRTGDLVVHSMDGFAGAIGVSDSDGKMSPVANIYLADGDARYFAYTLRVLAWGGLVTALAKGIRERSTSFDAPTIASLVLPRPSVDEQRRIADFLDDRVARIDQIITARQVQVALLDAIAARASYEAVTGANVSGERRSTDLAWLGDLPSEWPLLTVASQFQVDLGKMLDEKRQTGEHVIPYLRNTNVQWDTIDADDLKTMDIAPEERSRYTVKPGDLLICEGGQPGRGAIWTGSLSPLGYQKALHRARTRGRSRPAWLLECLRTAVSLNVFAIENEQTTIGHLTNEQLRSLRFPFPDPEVQDRFLADVARTRTQVAQAVRALRTSTVRLAEFKQSLITAAVTGEIDVSTASSGIPG